MSRLLPPQSYELGSSVYNPEYSQSEVVAGNTPALLPGIQQPQQQQPQHQQQSGLSYDQMMQIKDMMGGSGGGIELGAQPLASYAGGGTNIMGGTSAPWLGSSPFAVQPGAASSYMGAVPSTIGGGGAGAGAGAGGAGGGAGAAGGAGIGALAWPAAIAAAVGAAGHYQEKQGINTWGEHLTDFSGSHVRHGEELDRLANKWGGDNWFGDKAGDLLNAPMQISSGRPREMWSGVKNMFSPITSIADLWS